MFQKKSQGIAPANETSSKSRGKIEAVLTGICSGGIFSKFELNALLEPIFLSKPKQYWIDALGELGVPCGPVNELHEVFADPQVQEREMVIHMQHPQRAAMPLLANPIRLSETPIQYRLRPPDLGEHTDEVLADMLGYSAEQLSRLRADGAI